MKFALTPRNIIFLFVLLLVVLRLPSYFDDFMDSDEGIYGTVGLSIKHGDLPYRDAIERKTPLIYYTYAGVFWLFGDGNMLAVHLFLTLWIGLTAWVLFLIGKQLIAERYKDRLNEYPEFAHAPYWIAFAYIVFTTYYNFELLAANCEMFLDLPLALGFFYLLRGYKNSSFLAALLAGSCFGIAFLYKQTALIPFAAAGSFVLLNFCLGFSRRMRMPLGKNLWRLATWTIGLGGGFAGMIALSYLYFYSRTVHDDYYFWAWLVNFKYVHDSFDKSYVIKKFLIHTSFFALSLLPMWLAIAKLPANFRKLGVSTLLVLFWLLGELAALWISGKFYTHYYFLLMAPLAIFFGLGLAFMNEHRRRRIIAMSVVLGLFYCVTWFFRADLHRAYGYGAPDFRSIASYLEKQTSKEERIFVWGYSPEIYVLSKRLPASRFIFCDYLTGRISGHPRVKDPNFDTSEFATPGAWEMLQEDLEKKHPLYIIDTAPGNFHQYGKYPISRYPWLRDFIAQHYRQEADIAEAVLYRRK